MLGVGMSMSALFRAACGAASIGALLLALGGCHQEQAASMGDSAATPAGLLKASMDHYRGLSSLKANWDWSVSAGKDSTSQKRSLDYSAPNLFKYQTTFPTGEAKSSPTATVTCTSDGSKMMENSGKSGVMLAAPPTLSDTNQTATVFSNLKLGSSPLLWFFGGSTNYMQLVDDFKGAPRFGSEETVSGEKARHVVFYAGGELYGNTDILIGEKTGNVYRITYDMAPLVARQPKFKNLKVTESYFQVQDNPSVDMAEFVIKKPAGAKIVNHVNPRGPNPPVDEGEPMPDFAVKDLKTGKTVRLSSFRGKPVLIDYWATWCGPCKETLPHTESVYREFGKDKLQVITISNEDASKIQSFVQKNGYTFPIYQDATEDAYKALNIDGIPLVVIIDKNGNLSSYIQGGVPEEIVRRALKRVAVG